MTTMRKRRRNARPMTTHRRPVHQTPTRQLEGIPAAAEALSRALLNLSPQVPVQLDLLRNTPQGECGPADEPPRPAAGEPCFPAGHGRRRRGLSRPAARAVPRAAAWSCPHPSTASPQGQRFPHPANTSRCPLREGCPPSEPFLPFLLFRQAAVGHRSQGLLPHLSGYNIGPLDAYLGRAPVQWVPRQ